MKRTLATLAVIALAGCTAFHHGDDNPYEKPFYGKFLNTGSRLDQQIQVRVDALRANPDSAPLHNELGQLLTEKGFPKDAQTEFERAVDSDSRFYQAWYNLGVIRAARGDYSGAGRAFRKTTRLMKGHAEALFQLGLIAEKRGDNDEAIAYYAKALRHNRSILDVRTNPSVVDSRLVHLALLKNYPIEHARESGRFLQTPAGYVVPQREGVSPQAPAKDIVTPTAPTTDQATQPAATHT